MINSTDENKSTESAQIKKMSAKAKGPIRWGALIPFVIIVGCPMLYYTFFFDVHFKSALEKYGTQFNKAPVTVSQVKSSFLNASIEINRIEITDAQNHSMNSFVLGNIVFKMRWDALLRGKIVIDQASLLGIEINSPKTSVAVNERTFNLIATSFAKEDGGESENVKSSAANLLQEKYEGNVLGDLAVILEGGDPLANFRPTEDNYSSLKKVKELEVSVKEKEEKWQERISKLPSSENLDLMSAKVSAIDPKKIKNPKEVKEAVDSIKKIIDTTKTTIKVVKESKDAVSTDVKYFRDGISQIESLAKQDYEELEKKLKIPDINVSDLGTQLFKKYVMQKLGPYYKYVEMAQEYLPKNKNDKKEQIVKPARGQGRNYKFGHQNSYPLFWLKSAKISSTSNSSAFSGDIAGEIKNLSTDQKTVGRPIEIIFAGSFPKQQIMGVSSKLIFDHTQEVGSLSVIFKVESYPLTTQYFVDSDTVKFGYNKAVGSTDISGRLFGSEMELTFNNALRTIDYDVYAKAKILSDILKATATEAEVVTIDSKIVGSLSSPSIVVDSNLAKILKNSIGAQIDMKIAESKRKLKEMVDEQIAGPQKALEAKISDMSSKFESKIRPLEEKSSGLLKLGDKKIGSVNDQGSNAVKGTVKKQLGNLKKKIKL